MEDVNTFVKKFLEIGVSNGDGYGYGDGRGNGRGYGDGRGNGSGYGNGDGNGDGSGYGNGDGNGSGYGDGNGNGNGRGYGDGRGYGLISFDRHPVHYIDGIPTVIQSGKLNLAKGYIIGTDLTTSPCYVVKGNGYFAHGKTAKEAQAALRDKIFENMDVDEKINEFFNTFSQDKKYPARDFYKWHHLLTGSCEFGRNAFVKNHGIDLEHDTYTVSEFIEITKNDYGGEIIRQLEERM